MDLAPFVEELRHQLLVAAEAGGPEARELAERLTAAIEPAARLVLLDALSVAAGEITGDLAPGSVDVRLRGRDPEFVVALPPAEQSFLSAETVGAAAPAGTAGGTTGTDDGDGGTARITLRLAEHLKTRIEAAAGTDGTSVNSWLVRAVNAALDPRPGEQRAASAHTPPSSGQRFTGWAR